MSYQKKDPTVISKKKFNGMLAGDCGGKFYRRGRGGGEEPEPSGHGLLGPWPARPRAEGTLGTQALV